MQQYSYFLDIQCSALLSMKQMVSFVLSQGTRLLPVISGDLQLYFAFLLP